MRADAPDGDGPILVCQALDDVLVTEEGSRILGPPIPKHIDEVEALLATS